MRVKMVLAYDGREFSGWQVQPAKRTVQGELESGLSRLLGQPVRVFGAGRTDGGVHATGQVVHFDVEQPRVPVERLVLALRGYLPRDVRVLQVMPAAQDFHACFSACRRVYRYRFVTGTFFPHQRDYFAHFADAFVAENIRSILEVLIGEHDFTSFCLKDNDARTHVRRMESIELQSAENGFDIVFSATGFLRKMIRMIIGTLLILYGRGQGALEMQRILEARSNALSGAPAPAAGLYLERVDYARG